VQLALKYVSLRNKRKLRTTTTRAFITRTCATHLNKWCLVSGGNKTLFEKRDIYVQLVPDDTGCLCMYMCVCVCRDAHAMLLHCRMSQIRGLSGTQNSLHYMLIASVIGFARGHFDCIIAIAQLD